MKAQPGVVTARFIAILILVIPGIAATYGFLRMKDALFDYFIAFGDDGVTPSFAWLTFIGGFILFAIGIAFIGGWIFFRDRKHNYVAPRFRKKRPRPPKPTTRPGQ
jgi:hypothetical protein